MDTDEAKQKIHELSCMDDDAITVTGGEPTIRDDIIELLDLSKECGFSIIELQTNGLMLEDKAIAKEITDRVQAVLFALHSHRKEISDRITGEKSFERKIRALGNLSASGVNVTVSHVINKLNHADLSGFVEFISRHPGRINIYFSFVRPCGNAKNNRWIVPKLSETELDICKALSLCEKKGIHYHIEGMPLCYLCGHEHHSSELLRDCEKPFVYCGPDESGHKNLHEFGKNSLKAKAQACRQCSLDSICEGVWKEYAEIHGMDELYPVFSDKEKILRNVKTFLERRKDNR